MTAVTTRTRVTDLVIAGAGGFARETAAGVDAVNADRPTWRLLGFLDDDAALHGTERAGRRILGGLDRATDMADAALLVCVGNPRDFAVRERVVRRLGLPPSRYATLIHPSVSLGYDCSIGAGSVILAQCVLTTGVRIGAHVTVMPQVVITHDDVVGDYATVASGVRLGGGSVVGAGAYLGAGALVRESVHIGERSLVGMGSVVLHDIPPDQVWAGNPARYLRAGSAVTP